MPGGLLLLAGLMMFSTGLIGEMMMRTYFESQDRRIYAVREILTRKQRGVAGRREITATGLASPAPVVLEQALHGLAHALVIETPRRSTWAA